jgi:hypothetical protein
MTRQEQRATLSAQVHADPDAAAERIMRLTASLKRCVEFIDFRRHHTTVSRLGRDELVAVRDRYGYDPRVGEQSEDDTRGTSAA